MPTSKPAHPNSDAVAGAERLVAERFALGRCLGHRQGADIHMALDVETSDTVVLKSVPADAFTPGALMRLEYEASLLLQMRSDWVAPLVEFGRDGEQV